jgi:hypothetical protein
MRLMIQILLVLAPLSGRPYFDEDFGGGLPSWQSAGATSIVDGAARLGDESSYRTYLGRGSPVDSWVEVEFDVRKEVSDDTPPGTFLDTFFASIFFFLDPLTFDPADSGSFLAARGLLDADANGYFNVNGTLSPSARGPEWQTYRGTFAAPAPHAALAFELFDLNQTPGDSAVFLDSVRMVPEPGSFSLALVALYGLRLIRAQQTNRAVGLTSPAPLSRRR